MMGSSEASSCRNLLAQVFGRRPRRRCAPSLLSSIGGGAGGFTGSDGSEEGGGSGSEIEELSGLIGCFGAAESGGGLRWGGEGEGGG